MKQNIATSEIVLDKRRIKTDGTFPVKLRITFISERKYYGTSYYLNEIDWNLISSNKARGELRHTSLALSEIKLNAQKCCNSLLPFSFLKFETAFFVKPIPIIDLQSAFDKYIKQLNDNEQIGTAYCYNCACVSLHKFKPNLKLEHITPDFLRAYECWFTKNGKSLTTVGIYLRSLRSIMNMVIAEGVLDARDYPFGKRKYIIPTGRNIKKALTLHEMSKIFSYPAIPGSDKEMCRDYFIFIYLCNGLNVKDLCLLTYKDIDEDFIIFNRSKTIRTKRSDPTPIKVSLKEEAKRIVQKWGQPNISPETYIFPHIKYDMTPKEKRNTVQLLIHQINENMKKIAFELELNKPITTYYARHSFATILKNSGVSTEFIGEALGHSSLSTTKKYLASFEQEAIKRTTDVLMSFKNGSLENCA